MRGWAAGVGCNLALAADFTVAATDAVFWEPFIDRGFSPDSGSSWMLPRLVGLARARRMLILGEKVHATDAADWGLIDQAVSPAELDGTVEQLLARLACGPTVAIGLAKQGHSIIAAAQTWPQVTALRNKADSLGLSGLRVEKLDLLDPQDAARAASWEFDVLVNNAGVGKAGPSAKFPSTWYDRISRSMSLRRSTSLSAS